MGNLVNVGFSIVLALGIGFFPEYGALGVGLGTFIAKLFEAVVYMTLFILPGGVLSLEHRILPWDFVITRQLLRISIPISLRGGYQCLIDFPFNSLILVFGTEAVAAYHICRRIQQQLLAPLQRTLSTVTIILVGRELGAGWPGMSRISVNGLFLFSAAAIGIPAAGLYFMALWGVRLFTDDANTIVYGVGFLRAFLVGAPFLAFYNVISGALAAAGDSRTSFYGLIAREGARKLLQKALEAEIEERLNRYQDLVNKEGRKTVVKNGHGPE